MISHELDDSDRELDQELIADKAKERVLQLSLSIIKQNIFYLKEQEFKGKKEMRLKKRNEFQIKKINYAEL
jgi:hypothetical protein